MKILAWRDVTKYTCYCKVDIIWSGHGSHINYGSHRTYYLLPLHYIYITVNKKEKSESSIRGKWPQELSLEGEKVFGHGEWPCYRERVRHPSPT